MSEDGRGHSARQPGRGGRRRRAWGHADPRIYARHAPRRRARLRSDMMDKLLPSLPVTPGSDIFGAGDV
jgi:hypothetical protein